MLCCSCHLFQNFYPLYIPCKTYCALLRTCQSCSKAEVQVTVVRSVCGTIFHRIFDFPWTSLLGSSSTTFPLIERNILFQSSCTSHCFAQPTKAGFKHNHSTSHINNLTASTPITARLCRHKLNGTLSSDTGTPTSVTTNLEGQQRPVLVQTV